ncbi:MAG: RdgB/HAM1 family non-canonical purine NTP pyrophosphatase [Hydrogenophilus sp.]|nr:RdgB/HAM1 family non-canonical purine NTP pyrophosphatase [Hydrogenophilus sp.]
MMEIVLASNNEGKAAELAMLLAPLGVRWVPQSALGVKPTDEPYATFVENALAKARHAAQMTGRAALADDSGLVVPALGGAPGVRSARFAGEPRSDARNIEHLLREMEPLSAAERRAFFYSCLVLVYDAEDPAPLIGEGRWWGVIAKEPRGENGFGYDPVFYDPHREATAAELSPEEKNSVSHRAIAAARLIALVREEGGIEAWAAARGTGRKN